MQLFHIYLESDVREAVGGVEAVRRRRAQGAKHESTAVTESWPAKQQKETRRCFF